MRNRSVIGVVLLSIFTLGIYTIYWMVSTKKELNLKGASIPTAWLIIVPIVNIYWMWKYYEGAEQVTGGKVNGILMFIIALFVTSIISDAICQDAYNNLGEVQASTTPFAPVTPTETSVPVADVQVASPSPEVPNDTTQTPAAPQV